MRSSDNPPLAAVNMTAVTAEGTPVLVARDPKSPYTWQIIGPDPAFIRTDMTSPVSNYGMGSHGSNHQTADEANPGPDPVQVFQPMLYLLKTIGDGETLTVYTHAYDFNQGDASKYFAGTTTDLTSSVPGAGLVRKVLLYLDRDTVILEQVDGDTVLDNDVTPIPIPVPPAGVDATKSAWVKLSNGQTTISTATHIDDARDFLKGNSLPEPTLQGQILMYHEGGVQWAMPMINEDGYIMLTEDYQIMVMG
jgi:hypothetical protein